MAGMHNISEYIEVFEKLAKEYNSKNQGKALVAVAHHMDDQAETVLFNMARGSGLKGWNLFYYARDESDLPACAVSSSALNEQQD